MALIRNTLVFLDTRFFRDYKAKDATYRKLFEYSRAKKIRLCTSYICIEEWRTQKVSHLTRAMQDMTQKLVELPNTNYIASEIIDPTLHERFPDSELIVQHSKSGIASFIKENKIHVYNPQESHIWSTWSAYFRGADPFKQVKNRKDIPDAWILECAKDALSDDNHQNTENKFCIGEDNTLCGALKKLGFETLTVLTLIEKLEKEEAGEVTEQEEAPIIEAREEAEEREESGLSPLDRLLAKAINKPAEGIYLRLLGFVAALDTPSHESLIERVVSKGYDRKLTEACAVILSDKSNPYIKDTGNHYIVGNKEICEEATSRLTQEIIDMLDEV